MGSFDVVLKIAREQRGLVRYDQLIEKGVPRQSISTWKRQGRLIQVHPRVYALASAPRTWEQSVLAAVLATDGAACLRSASRLWGLWPATESVDVLAARGTNSLRGVYVHTSTTAPEIALRHGIPTTTPPYTLTLLGGVASKDDVRDVVGRALTSRLVTVAALEAAILRLSGPGVRGTRVLRSILREWELGKRPADSVLETRMATLMARFKLPRPDFQFVVRVGGRFVARVDFAYPTHRLAIEVDGHEFHALATDRRRDAERRNQLAIAGWTVLVFTWTQVVREGADVAALVAAQLGVRTLAI